MQHYDYIERINKWAKERGIFEFGSVEAQLEKSREENAELTKAITKYEKGNKEAIEEIKDAIGDVYVTLVVATSLADLRTYLIFRNCKPEYIKMPVKWKYFTRELRAFDNYAYNCFTNEETTVEDIKDMIYLYVRFLNDVANYYNLKLTDCIEYAYNTISKRKGKMIDGSFVKEK